MVLLDTFHLHAEWRHSRASTPGLDFSGLLYVSPHCLLYSSLAAVPTDAINKEPKEDPSKCHFPTTKASCEKYSTEYKKYELWLLNYSEQREIKGFISSLYSLPEN